MGHRKQHPPLDPELAVALGAIKGQIATVSLTPDLIPSIRSSVEEQTPSLASLSTREELSFLEISIVGKSDRTSISLLVCQRSKVVARAPGILFLHPGGTIAGNNRTGLEPLLEWVVELGVVVISVEYRLSPEYPYPAPLEDCYQALTWISEHGEQVGVDSDRLFLVGTSAGGGLAAGVSLFARDQAGPLLKGQMLFGPMLDDRMGTPSSQELEGTGTWDRISNQTGWSAYLGDREGSKDVPYYSSPSRAPNLADLPPTYLDVGSVETFRDETVDFAVRIWQAGGDAELHVWGGAFHGFDEVSPAAELSKLAKSMRIAWLRHRIRQLDQKNQPEAL
jgi:acetyl esterase/lipase